MKIENLFPTPIGIFNFNEKISEKEKNFLLDQPQRSNEGNTSSVNKYILKQKILSNITTFIEKSLHEYFMATICPKNDVRLKITQSWINWTQPNQYHHKHLHANSLISGCFYINANKNTDKIFFFRDEPNIITFPPIEWNLYNSKSWWLPIGSNELIFFPSNLTHMVKPVEGDDTRISLAFNTFPIGDIGDENDLTALRLEK